MQEIIVAGTEKVNIEVFKVAATVSEEDKIKIREYGKLLKAREELIKQLNKLDALIDTLDASWCRKYLWTNKLGEVVPLFDIDNDYLKNIVQWVVKNDGRLSKEIKKEYYSRFGYSDIINEEGSKYAPKKTLKRNPFKSFEDDSYDEF